MLITEREDIKPLLGMGWLRELNWTMRHIEKPTTPTDQSERNKIITPFEKLVQTNSTNKVTENKMQLKPGHIPIKQKARPIPCQLRNYVEKERNKLLKS